MGRTDERLRALGRLLLDAGDITPMGARMLERVLDEMAEPITDAAHALSPAQVHELWARTGRERFPVPQNQPSDKGRTISLPLSEDAHAEAFARALGVTIDEDMDRLEPSRVAHVSVRTRNPGHFVLVNVNDGTRWRMVQRFEGWAWARETPATADPQGRPADGPARGQAAREARRRYSDGPRAEAFVSGYSWALERDATARAALDDLGRVLASPPPGWYTLGTHADEDGPLEYWGDDGTGMPLWERPSLDVVGMARQHADDLYAPQGRTEVMVQVSAFVDGALWVAEQLDAL